MKPNTITVDRLSSLTPGEFGVVCRHNAPPLVVFKAGGTRSDDPMRWLVLLREDGSKDPFPFALHTSQFDTLPTTKLNPIVELEINAVGLLNAVPSQATPLKDWPGCILIRGSQRFICFRELHGTPSLFTTIVADFDSGATLDPAMNHAIDGILIRTWKMKYKLINGDLDNEIILSF